MPNITINNKKLQAPEGWTVLKAAREHGISIPALCDHEGVEPYGACRLCMVEIKQGNRSRLVASCLYPAEEGLVVETDSERALAARKVTAELLLARSPHAKKVQDIAAALGIKHTDLVIKGTDCILCALCVRTCREVVGASAISLSNRGVEREVAPPLGETAHDCIGCGSCVYVCPTNFIKMDDVDGVRKIHNWKVEFKMKKCKVCGNYIAPEKQLEHFSKKLGIPLEFFDTCTTCRK